jgi:3-isopropylmalate/(R)-2-methylmalate dehydratase large subunit
MVKNPGSCSGRASVKVGDVLEPRVDLAMSHENAALVLNQFRKSTRVLDSTPKFGIQKDRDHLRSPSAAESSKTASRSEEGEFIGKQGIGKFHDVRGDVGGICHQVLPEYGYVRPGSVVVGTDSHTTSHGAVGCFSFGIGATEMASVWALGNLLNVEVPATIKVLVYGKFPANVLPKDLILYLIGQLTAEGANFKVIEFGGEAVANMPTSGRLTICNMSVEAGATSGIVPPDAETLRYLKDVAGLDESYRPSRPTPTRRMNAWSKSMPRLLLLRSLARIPLTMSSRSTWSLVPLCSRSSSARAQTDAWMISKSRQRFWRGRRSRAVFVCWSSRPPGASTARQ